MIRSVYLVYTPYPGLSIDKKKIIPKTAVCLCAQIHIGQRIVGFLFSDKY
jgi:hypothetical protein